MSQSQAPFNPFEGSQAASQAFAPAIRSGNLEHLKALKQFRQQIHALGGFWIIIGSILAIAALLIFPVYGMDVGKGDELVVQVIIACGIGLVWLFIGIAISTKSIGAVYLGLGLSYLTMIDHLINLATTGNLIKFCGLMILAVAIVQAHRVLGFAKRLRVLGIPLTTRPEQLTMQVAPPPGQWPT